jgi:hypothetical protein
MKENECVVGARVICKFQTYLNQIGTIMSVCDIGTVYSKYYVIGDDGHLIGPSGWRRLDSWDIYTGLTRVPLTGFKLTPVPEDLPIKTASKECPCGISRADCDYHK